MASRLNEQGTTVVYTSHYMEEVEQLCTRLMIMDHGRSLAMGTVEELQRSISTGEKIKIDVGDIPEETLDRIRKLSHVITASVTDGELVCACENGTSNLSEVLAVLSNDNVSCGRIACEPPTLNDVFLEITGRELRD